MNSYYSENELMQIGFRSFGTNVLISRKASIYSPENMIIGDNVRVDDFCILSGKITLGSYIHIAAYSALYGGKAGIGISDFSNVSSRVCIYAVSDDYSGNTMTSPLIPQKYKNVEEAPVIIEKNVIIGSGCTVLPGVVLKEGSAFGAMTLVNHDAEAWSINVGIPFVKKKNRSDKLLVLEAEFLKEISDRE